ncbi:MAG: hypothetical protein M1819_003430 [Sarea resinae]|nr:MAG: hypothetical protein M1819_003430 [Sarea resinae]
MEPETLAPFLSRPSDSSEGNDSLRAAATNIVNGDYNAVLTDELAQLLLGHTSSPALEAVRYTECGSWSGFIKRRVDALLQADPAHRSGQEADSLLKGQRTGTLEAHLLLIATAALNAFLQSNVTGPPPPFASSTTIFPSSSQLPPYAQLRKQLLASLTVDAVPVYALTPHIELFSLAHAILTHSGLVESAPGARWARCRVLFLWQRMLDEVSATVQTAIYGDLEVLRREILGDSTTDATGAHKYTTDARVRFLLERAAIHTFHGFDSKARDDLEDARQMTGLEVRVTGLMGKRTRFQEKEISQLVVLARSREEEEKSDRNGEGEVEGNRSGGGDKSGGDATTVASTAATAGPKNLDLNDDTLLERISFASTPDSSATSSARNPLTTTATSETELPASLASLDPSSQPQLSPLDSILLLSLASSITNTSPQHGLTREETLPYAVRVLEGGSSNWQIYTQALLVRSRIEGYRSRTVERGVLQLQAIVDQVIAETMEKATGDATTGGDEGSNTTDTTAATATTFLPRAKAEDTAPVQDRLRYIHALSSPTRWELEAELAARWVSLGGLRTALEIYERLEMWAEVALCWAGTEREDKARTVVRRLIFRSTKEGERATDGEKDIGKSAEDGETETDTDTDTETWEGPERDPLPADAPRLFCILGDLSTTSVPSDASAAIAYYGRAWTISKQRYSRAQRSLARLYFSAHDYVRAEEAYATSLKLNPLHHATWFALGCVRLELQWWQGAVQAFARAVQLDDQDAQAWSNLAAALLRLEPGSDSSSPPESNQDGKKIILDDEDESVAQATPAAVDPQRHRRDALHALQKAARLKHDDFRIWDNLLTVGASVAPPAYTDVAVAQKRLIELRGATVGEKCVDAEILEHLVRHVIVASMESAEGQGQGQGQGGASAGGYDPAKPGLARMVVDLVDSSVVPLITSSARLWRIVAQLALWRRRPSSALEAHEKAWRAVLAQPGWEYGGGGAGGSLADAEAQWNGIVDATVELVDAYESLGEMERTEGLAAGSGQLVAKDWKFKARSAIRGVLGRAKDGWEGSDGWERLKACADGLRG